MTENCRKFSRYAQTRISFNDRISPRKLLIPVIGQFHFMTEPTNLAEDLHTHITAAYQVFEDWPHLMPESPRKLLIPLIGRFHFMTEPTAAAAAATTAVLLKITSGCSKH